MGKKSLDLSKYAAIDVGSNGVRLLVSNVTSIRGKRPHFKKSALVRVPIRLGKDVFREGKISEYNIRRLADAMHAFRLIMQIHEVRKFRACATSAMREAANGREVTDQIYDETGVRIEIIDGKTEAGIIASTDLYEIIEKKHDYLYVDVGGGSTELTFFSGGKPVVSKSFKIGSVRVMTNKKIVKEVRKEMKEWIKKHKKSFSQITLIGSGGNINKIYKISDKKLGKPLEYCYLQKQYKKIAALTYEERIYELGLNPDRADVIIPAMKIYLSAMKWVGADEVIVPQIGLADGMIKQLYQEG